MDTLTASRAFIYMKKIIKHGFKYDLQTRCINCGCHFSYEWEDVLISYTYNLATSAQNTHPLSFTHKVTCPECGAWITVYNNWIPIDYDRVTLKFTGGKDD